MLFEGVRISISSPSQVPTVLASRRNKKRSSLIVLSLTEKLVVLANMLILVACVGVAHRQADMRLRSISKILDLNSNNQLKREVQRERFRITIRSSCAWTCTPRGCLPPRVWDPSRGQGVGPKYSLLWVFEIGADGRNLSDYELC